MKKFTRTIMLVLLAIVMVGALAMAGTKFGPGIPDDKARMVVLQVSYFLTDKVYSPVLNSALEGIEDAIASATNGALFSEETEGGKPEANTSREQDNKIDFSEITPAQSQKMAQEFVGKTTPWLDAAVEILKVPGFYILGALIFTLGSLLIRGYAKTRGSVKSILPDIFTISAAVGTAVIVLRNPEKVTKDMLPLLGLFVAAVVVVVYVIPLLIQNIIGPLTQLALKCIIWAWGAGSLVLAAGAAAFKWNLPNPVEVGKTWGIVGQSFVQTAGFVNGFVPKNIAWETSLLILVFLCFIAYKLAISSTQKLQETFSRRR